MDKSTDVINDIRWDKWLEDDVAVVTVTSTISRSRIADLLISALEGGSNYWYYLRRYEMAASLDIGEFAHGHITIPLTKGCTAVIIVKEECVGDVNAGREFRLNLDSVAKGAQIMSEKYPRHWGDFLSENDDAETGDVFLQCCLFGDIIYG